MVGFGAVPQRAPWSRRALEPRRNIAQGRSERSERSPGVAGCPGKKNGRASLLRKGLLPRKKHDGPLGTMNRPSEPRPAASAERRKPFLDEGQRQRIAWGIRFGSGTTPGLRKGLASAGKPGPPHRCAPRRSIQSSRTPERASSCWPRRNDWLGLPRRSLAPSLARPSAPRARRNSGFDWPPRRR